MGWMRRILGAGCCLMIILTAAGCAGGSSDRTGALAEQATQQRTALHNPIVVPQYLRIVNTKMHAGNGTLDIYTEQMNAASASPSPKQARSGRQYGEDIIDTANLEGIVNYATSTFADRHVRLVRIFYNRARDGLGQPGLFAALPVVEQPSATPESMTGKSDSIPTFVSNGTQVPPPGVWLDSNIRPLATRYEGREAKVRALIRVADSKLGTRYVWGHNEDRGQYGFDCSNFTEYVYHHALGYSFSSASRLQYSRVGVRVPIASMEPGDLLCFDHGAHVGIYAGNGRMIQCGGGLGRVGYLKIGPGWYWHNHISAVKRMF